MQFFKYILFNFVFISIGNLQSCIKEQETSNSNSPIKDQNGIVEYPRIERFSQIGSTSPSRLFKRISIRVVPDVKKFDINNEDTQFLEAYGIPSSQTKTVSSIQENDKSIGKLNEFSIVL